jgi:hypothetical protein
MNFIAYDAAYSLYPKATFEDRRNLVFKDGNDNDQRCIAKYAKRGWYAVANVWPQDPQVSNLFHVGTHRLVHDDKSWVMPLDTTDVTAHPRLSACSDPIYWDPCRHNGWILTSGGHEWKMHLVYFLTRSSIYRYGYLTSTVVMHNSLKMFGKYHKRVQFKRVAKKQQKGLTISWRW